ncbi:hypothetical protein B6D60_11625 [candidate division KSB1 bacterium 4484_87]|nr:MAG: hypothetical protein B6D60_11625 [candidate division KSB1 bacterium 4484_87]
MFTDKKPGKYTILLGDIINSSRYNGVQKKLHDAAEWINRQFDICWQTPLEITRGDEVAVIAKPNNCWFRSILRFNDRIRPLRMRWVMVYGEIKEGLVYQSSSEATGPAFIDADQLMHKLKKSNLRFDISTGASRWDDILRGHINLLLWRIDQLSDLQLQVFRLYQTRKRQIDVAQSLGRSQQQIQRALKAMNWQVIDAAEESALKLVTLAMEEITS